MLSPIFQAHSYSFVQEFETEFQGKRVLVTGATGFVGLNLCQALHAIGAEVIGAALPDSVARASQSANVVPIDLSEESSAQRLMEAARPDIVFHLAGLVDTRQSPDLVLPTLTHNLLGSVHLLAGLVGIPCRRVIVVTSAETPRPGQSPSSPYAASKQALAAYAEMYQALYEVPIVLVRPHMVYGPYQPAHKLIPYLIRCGLDHTPPLLSSGKRVCDPIYVKDFVRALLSMAVREGVVGLTLDVGRGEGLSVAEIAARVLQQLGADTEPVFGAVPDRVGDASQVADTRLIEAKLGWRPAWTLEEGLAETIAWFRGRPAHMPGDTLHTAREVLE